MKEDCVKICGFDIYFKDKEDLLLDIENKEKLHIVSGNPEVLYTALYNEKLLSNFREDTSLIIPDGVGVKVAANLKGLKLKEKIAGIELMDSLIKRAELKGESIYLLGSTDESLEGAIHNLKEKYPNLIIAGSNNGYFTKEDEFFLIEDIKESKADMIFVALGCPKQEEFIITCMEKVNAKIFMGVGGSFDVISGNKKRAPKILISLGLEWLYRVSKEPKRITRLVVIPKFLLKAIKM